MRYRLLLALLLSLVLLCLPMVPSLVWADDGGGMRGGKLIDPPAYNHGMWAGQAECRRYAEYDMAVVYFDMWAHVRVDPADIKYTCTPYHGPD